MFSWIYLVPQKDRKKVESGFSEQLGFSETILLIEDLSPFRNIWVISDQLFKGYMRIIQLVVLVDNGLREPKKVHIRLTPVCSRELHFPAKHYLLSSITTKCKL